MTVNKRNQAPIYTFTKLFFSEEDSSGDHVTFKAEDGRLTRKYQKAELEHIGEDLAIAPKAHYWAAPLRDTWGRVAHENSHASRMEALRGVVDFVIIHHTDVTAARDFMNRKHGPALKLVAA